MRLLYNYLFSFIFCISSLAFCKSKPWPLIIIPSQPFTISLHNKTCKRLLSYSQIKKEKFIALQEKLFSPQTFVQELDHGKKNHTPSMIISVLLAKSDEKLTEWCFKSQEGFIVTIDGEKKKDKKVTFVKIRVKNNYIWFNGKRVKKSLFLFPINGYGECNGIMYDGYFSLIADKKQVLCINNVELEKYITAVLKTESWPGWPLEVNKVFAITCRSYVAFKVFEAQRNGRLFHVKNTNAHQTYKGKHDIQVLKTAVEQTKGIVLGFDNKPILAMFDSCCGGIIPAHIADFNFQKVPYLARSYPCTFCKNCSLYSWQIIYTQPDFEKVLRDYYHTIIRLSDIPHKKDKAGVVQEVYLQQRSKRTIISGKQLYSLFKEIKSFSFDINKKLNTIVVTGHGFGHHMGLCQWGTRQMVAEGWDYKSILRFYFPGTFFMKLIK